MFEKLKFPRNASYLNSAMISVAQFDIIDTPNWVDPYFFDLGESSPYSEKFAECDFESTWFLANSSTIIWIYIVNFAVFLVYLLIVVFSSLTGKLRPLKSKLGRYFIFSGPLRLFMETFLNLYLSALLNTMTAEDDSTVDENSSVTASNRLALAVLIAMSISVLALGLLYYCKFDRMDGDTNYGALLDGTKIKSKKKSRWILLLPAFFFVRRIVFTLSVLLIRDFLWAQLAIQFAFSILMIIYLMHVWPLETPFATKMEVYNECTIIVLSYGLLCFTDFVVDPVMRYELGWYYMAASVTNILVHIIYLASGSGVRVKLTCRRKCNQLRSSKIPIAPTQSSQKPSVASPVEEEKTQQPRQAPRNKSLEQPVSE